MNPRKPTQEEKKLLAEYILRDEDPELYDLGKIDPERKAEVEEAIEAAAKANNQTVSEWVRSTIHATIQP